jgi:hypothetical protein
MTTLLAADASRATDGAAGDQHLTVLVAGSLST